MKGGNFNKLMKSIDVEQIVVGVLIIILVILVVVYVNKNNEGFNDGNKPTLYFFYVDWCPHCSDAKDEVFGESESDNSKWDNNNSLTNKGNVNLVKVNCEGSEENKALAKKHNVRGYPTLVLESNNNTAHFNGNSKSVPSVNKFISNESINSCKQGKEHETHVQ